MSLLGTITQTPCPRAWAALLTATLAVLIDALLRPRASRSPDQLPPGTGTVKTWGGLALVFLQLVALSYLIVLLPGPLRVLALLFCLFLIIIQCSYWLTLSQFMTATDLFLALTVSGDHRLEAIASFFQPVVFSYALPYALALSPLVLVPTLSGFWGTLALSLLPLLYLVASNYLLFLHLPERSCHLNPLTSFLRAALTCQFESRRIYRGPRDGLPDSCPARRPLDSLIYVIDESVRGSNLSLNGYPRPTTPFLEDLEGRGRLKNLGICVAAGSFSHISNAYLITGHNAFPDSDFRTEKNPTIFDYAKKMGYQTLYIDVNQIYLYALRKAAGDGPVRSLDGWMNDKTFQERHIDLDVTKDPGVARLLSEILNEKSGYFILVNKKGLHFSYRNRYPDDVPSTLWEPVMKATQAIDPTPAGREKLVNTYDNGIRFQVDEFFRELVSRTTNPNYAVLYTSDHGQTLAEHGQRYTHMKPDPEIVDVPGFLVSGEGYGKQGLIDGIAPGTRVSHLNNFATLLDLMGVPDSLRVRPYHKSIFALTTQDNQERHYLSGSLYGLGDYVVQSIASPPGAGWGISSPVFQENNDHEN
jgi:glucan phosphoethanolaminetransferase (alkaline phosphatase superfamily)